MKGRKGAIDAWNGVLERSTERGVSSIWIVIVLEGLIDMWPMLSIIHGVIHAETKEDRRRPKTIHCMSPPFPLLMRERERERLCSRIFLMECHKSRVHIVLAGEIRARIGFWSQMLGCDQQRHIALYYKSDTQILPALCMCVCES